jgi:Arc/MetJ family transcription regulator
MRTNIEIDDELMRQAMLLSGKRTKNEVVEAGLRLLIEAYPQTGIRRLKGKIRWEGDLGSSRRGQVQD